MALFPLRFGSGVRSLTVSLIDPVETAADFWGYESGIGGTINPNSLIDSGGTSRAIDILRARIGAGTLQLNFAGGVQFNGWTQFSVEVVGWGTATGVLWESANSRYRTLSNASGLAEYLRDNSGPFTVNFTGS